MGTTKLKIAILSLMAIAPLNMAFAQVTPLSYKVGRIVNNSPINFKGKTGIGEANGVLVSPCLVMTNAHVVYGDDLNPDPNADHTVWFKFGEGIKDFKWVLKGTPVYHGRRDEVGLRDVVLVQLEKCPGKKLGWLRPVELSREELQKANLRLVAIPPGPSNGKVEIQSNCREVDRTYGGIMYNCRSEGGYSGAAVLDDNGDLVALNQAHTGLTEGDTEQLTIALTMVDVFSDPEAQRVIDQDMDKFAAEIAAFQAAHPSQ